MALSLLTAVLILLCFPDCVSHFLFMCILLVIVSSAFSCLFLFSMLLVVSGVSVLRFLAFPWVLSPAFRVLLLFFGISFMFWVLFPSILFWYSCLLLLSLDLLGFASLVGFAFSCSSGGGSTFSLPFLYSLFRMLQFRLLPAFFLSIFPHAVATIVSVLPPRFSTYCSFGCPFLFLSPFSVCCDAYCSFWSSSRFFRILSLRLLFAFGTPPVVFRAAGSLLAVPRLSRCCFPCVSARFLSPGFHRLLRFSLHVPRAAFSPLVCSPPHACCGVLHSSFGSSSTGSALLCLVWHYGSLFSDSFESPGPVAMWSPFGMSQDCFSLCFSQF